jgi:hypothetical protein
METRFGLQEEDPGTEPMEVCADSGPITGHPEVIALQQSILGSRRVANYFHWTYRGVLVHLPRSDPS